MNTKDNTNKQARLKCLHCGHEYATAGNPETEERVCPKCHSNSVRLLRTLQ